MKKLTTLQLTSQLSALRREIKAQDNLLQDREARLARQEADLLSWKQETEHLRNTIRQIEQGRVMRLLNGINRILKGTPSRKT